MTVHRIRGKIIRTVLCCIVYDSGAQWYIHTYEQLLKLAADLGLDILYIQVGLLLCVFLSLLLFC